MARGFGATLGVGATDVIISALAANEPTAMTLVILANRNGNGGSSLGRIVDKHPGDGVVLYSTLTGTNYRFGAAFSGTDGEWTIVRPATSVWRMVAVTFDGSSAANNPLMYLDGVSQTVTEGATPTGTFAPTTTAWHVGNSTTLNRGWDGLLAEFAVWNRILSAAEIAFLTVTSGSVYRSPGYISNGLIEYVPLNWNLGSQLLAAPSVTGTAAQTHPTVRYPRGLRFGLTRNRLVVAA